MLRGKEHVAAAVLTFRYKNREEFGHLFLKILGKVHLTMF